MAPPKETKTERKKPKAARTRPAHPPAEPSVNGPRAEASPQERIEWRVARIEEAVAKQGARSEKLVKRLKQLSAVKESEEPAVTLLSGAVDRESVEGLERGLRLRIDNLVRVKEPLVLICQAQRSGGTLLARLFDGHPQCHAHPHELLIGGRIPHAWPKLPLDEPPESWFATLREEKVEGLFSKGRRKIPLKTRGDKPEGTYPFLMPPSLQRLIFLEEVARRGPISSQRQILDCYMTSLFNAWLDYQNLQGPKKRWVVAFSPRRAWDEGLDEFFDLYPDGRLISILRDPLSWYTSAQGRDPDAEPQALLQNWKRSAAEMRTAVLRFPKRVRIVRFDELLLDTAAVMRRLAAYLRIDFDPQLTLPTFNRYPVGSNSSYDMHDIGVGRDPVERYKELLSKEQQAMIRAECQDLYEQALAVAERQDWPDAKSDALISLRAATVDQLEAIDGIGRATAEEIVRFRDERGPLTAIEELSAVRGVGPATIAALRERVQP